MMETLFLIALSGVAVGFVLAVVVRKRLPVASGLLGGVGLVVAAGAALFRSNPSPVSAVVLIALGMLLSILIGVTACLVLARGLDAGRL
ncbi:hypothetical protein [Sphingomonas oryzagri]